MCYHPMTLFKLSESFPGLCGVALGNILRVLFTLGIGGDVVLVLELGTAPCGSFVQEFVNREVAALVQQNLLQGASPVLQGQPHCDTNCDGALACPNKTVIFSVVIT